MNILPALVYGLLRGNEGLEFGRDVWCLPRPLGDQGSLTDRLAQLAHTPLGRQRRWLSLTTVTIQLTPGPLPVPAAATSRGRRTDQELWSRGIQHLVRNVVFTWCLKYLLFCFWGDISVCGRVLSSVQNSLKRHIMTINNVLTNVMINVLADPVVEDVLSLLGGGGHVVPAADADLGLVGALAPDGVDAEEAAELVLGAQGGDGDVGVTLSHQLVSGRLGFPPLAANDEKEDKTDHGQGQPG